MGVLRPRPPEAPGVWDEQQVPGAENELAGSTAWKHAVPALLVKAAKRIISKNPHAANGPSATQKPIATADGLAR